MCTDLLSRKPDAGDTVTETEPFELDINDNTFEFGAIISNEINLKDFASCNMPAKEGIEIPALGSDRVGYSH